MINAELADEIERQISQRDVADVGLELDQWQQIIAALRQPSSNRVLVPMEPTQAMRDAGRRALLMSSGGPTTQVLEAYHAMLSAAEAEGRKP